MGKVTTIYCDACNKEVKGTYYTIATQKHTKGAEAEKLGTGWLCEECFERIIAKNISSGGES